MKTVEIPLPDGLTEPQKKFCLHMIENGFRNAHECAIKAGYAKKDATNAAYRLRKIPAIQEFIRVHMEKKSKEIEKEFDDRFDWAIKRLEGLVEMFFPKDGEKLSPENARIVIAAMAEISKMRGLYSAEKRVVDFNVSMDVHIKEIRLALEEYEREY